MNQKDLEEVPEGLLVAFLTTSTASLERWAADPPLAAPDQVLANSKDCSGAVGAAGRRHREGGTANLVRLSGVPFLGVLGQASVNAMDLTAKVVGLLQPLGVGMANSGC